MRLEIPSPSPLQIVQIWATNCSMLTDMDHKTIFSNKCLWCSLLVPGCSVSQRLSLQLAPVMAIARPCDWIIVANVHAVSALPPLPKLQTAMPPTAAPLCNCHSLNLLETCLKVFESMLKTVLKHYSCSLNTITNHANRIKKNWRARLCAARRGAAHSTCLFAYVGSRQTRLGNEDRCPAQHGGRGSSQLEGVGS